MNESSEFRRNLKKGLDKRNERCYNIAPTAERLERVPCKLNNVIKHEAPEGQVVLRKRKFVKGRQINFFEALN